MITLVVSSSFKRAFKNSIKRRPDLKSKITQKLELLAKDPYNPALRTHKLKGKLAGAWACSVEYHCRIILPTSNQRSPRRNHHWRNCP